MESIKKIEEKINGVNLFGYTSVRCKLLKRITEDVRENSNARKILESENIILRERVSKLEEILLQFKEKSFDLSARNDDCLKKLECKLESIYDTVSRANKGKNDKVVVLFIIHNIAVFDSIKLVVDKLLKERNFEVILISTDKKFPGDFEFGGEEQIHNFLKKHNYPHVRLGNSSKEFALKIIKNLNPDFIFRQSPWDADLPNFFNAQELKFAKLCYIPYYGLQFLEDMKDYKFHVDQDYHRFCSLIFTGKDAKNHKNALLSQINVVDTGSPKYEYLRDEITLYENNKCEKPIIIWSPHHSFGTNWLSFATFNKTYKYILDLVRNHPEVHFVFRPHPAFINACKSSKLLSERELAIFFDIWHSLPNTSESYDDDYAKLFAQSSALITDGISFLASYQITGKPLFWLVNPNHVPFSDLGKEMIKGCYQVQEHEYGNIEDIVFNIIDSNYKNDILKQCRRSFVDNYLCPKESPSDKIVNILKELR